MPNHASQTPDHDPPTTDPDTISRRNALALGSLFPALGLAGLSCASLPSGSIVRADPRDFGAVGDGKANDAPAIQAALDSSLCVELAPTTYALEEPLELRDHQMLLGCGSTLKGIGTPVGIRRMRNTQFVSNPVVRDLRLQGFSTALDAEGMQLGRFENLFVESSGTGFRLATGTHGYCYYNVFTSCHTADGVKVGLLCEGSLSQRFRNEDGEPRWVGPNGNLFQGCKLGGESICVDIHAPVKALVFTSCSLERGLPDISLLALGTENDANDDPDAKVRKVSFYGCNFEGGAVVDGIFQKGRMHIGPFAEDCSFFGSVIPGGTEVIDKGHLTNWLPTQGRGGNHELFALVATHVHARSFEVLGADNRTIMELEGADHRMRVRDREGVAKIHLEGTSGRITGESGRFRQIIAIDPAGTARIEIDGPDAAVRVGNGVGSGHAGRIEVRNRAGRSTIVLDGQLGRVLTENGDCAEELDLAPGESAGPGDVVVFGRGGGLTRCSVAYDRRVAGIVSGAGDEAPGVVLGRKPGVDQDRRRPLALNGRAYCRVDAGFGAIEIGDLLTTSSTVGHAMKATEAGQAFGAVIGKALAGLRRGRGLIPVLVALQ